MFPNANISAKHSNFTIVNGDSHNHHNYVNSCKPALEILYKHAAPGAFHISSERYDPPKCHEDTRITIRRDLMDQVTMAVVSCIVWLYGAAGAGKSAIAQSFAQTCEELGLLIGTFFFFRAAPLRNNAQRLAASLAYQLSQSIPSTFQYIARYITTHPAIFSSSFKEQIDKLFTQPLRMACEDDPTLSPRPRLIILDGLDECDKPKIQENILTVFEKALQDMPIPIVVLVTSRPEIHISSTFISLERHSRIPIFRFGLNDNYDAEGDIRLYLNDKFKEIKRDHPFNKYLPNVWPHPREVDLIVWKSSGQFIYAATIIRYIGYYQCKPHDRLQRALDASRRFTSTVHDSPFKELDALYFQVFSGLEDVMTTLAILCLALDVKRDDTRWPQTITSRLGLRPGDVELHISSLSSLMKFEGETIPISFFHASLHDFLIDEQRSHHLYIDQPAVHTVLSKAYIRRFLASASFPLLLDAMAYHLARAAQDQELSDLALEAEAEIPKFIMAFQPKAPQRMSHWDGDVSGRSFKAIEWATKSHSDLFSCAYKLRDITVQYTKSPTFWTRCTEAIYEVFYKELSVYLTSEATHDFLVLVALVDKFDSLPFDFGFASSLGVSRTEWDMCSKASIFSPHGGPERPSGLIRQLLKEFLSDPHLSRELFPTSEQFARIALKCLNLITESYRLAQSAARLLHNIPTLTHHESFLYEWAIASMIYVLPRAAICHELINRLRLFNHNCGWLKMEGIPTDGCQKAIDLYLENHLSKPSGGNTLKRSRKQSFKEPLYCQSVFSLDLLLGDSSQARGVCPHRTIHSMTSLETNTRSPLLWQ